MSFRINRMEFAGSLGDLGVLLPMGLGMIMVNQLNPQGLFFGVGLFYILAGCYFGVTVPVQPMKVIGSYAIAMGLASEEIFAAGLGMGVLLLLIGLSGAMTRIATLIPRSVIRGIQLSTGLLLMAEGVRFILGRSSYQLRHGSAEPFFELHQLLGIPINWIFGLSALFAILLLLNSKTLPASTMVIGAGILAGLLLGTGDGPISMGLHLPQFLPTGLPTVASLTTAMLVLVLPQLPMTLGNAVLANVDLAQQYFGPKARRSTGKALCISMGLANIGAFLLGGMPMCHGAGGLAAHYRFGARTAGSNLIIGSLFIGLALMFGDSVVAVARLIPMSVLGVLLFYAGSELALAVVDVDRREDLFIVVMIVGITMASNLALGFTTGTVVHYLIRWRRLTV